MIDFKSKTGNTDNIVVSFHFKWVEIFRSDPPAVVFRHRTPVKNPKYMYIYAGAPLSSIIGKCEIVEIAQVNIDTAMNLLDDGGITKEDLSDYLEGYEEVGLYYIDKVKVAKTPIDIKEIRASGRFFPPQSLLFLSDEGAEYFDKKLVLN